MKRSLRAALIARFVLPALKRRAARTDALTGGAAAKPAPPPASAMRRLAIEEIELAGIGAYSLRRCNMQSTDCLLYLHGGAFILPLMKEHWSILTALAASVDAAIVVPDYPLAAARLRSVAGRDGCGL